jgi:hypothetical protein
LPAKLTVASVMVLPSWECLAGRSALPRAVRTVSRPVPSMPAERDAQRSTWAGRGQGQHKPSGMLDRRSAGFDRCLPEGYHLRAAVLFRSAHLDKEDTVIVQLAVDLAAAVMAVEQVPDIPMFRQNTAAFIHDLPAAGLSNIDGDTNYVRIQVLTNAGALDRGKQLAVVEQLTASPPMPLGTRR